MSLTELFIIAVGLSMDAFAVSVCKAFRSRGLSWAMPWPAAFILEASRADASTGISSGQPVPERDREG